MLRKNKWAAYGLVIFSCLAATLSFYFWQVAKSPNLNVDGDETKVLYIYDGAIYDDVVDSLNAKKLIHDQISFGFLTKYMKYREVIKPGRYEIPPNSGNKEIIAKLRAGEQDPLRLTFNNVRLKQDLAKKLSAKLLIEEEKLIAMLNDPEVCQKYGFTPETIMCMFLPDTYELYWNSTETAFMDRMKKEYDRFWTEERLQKAATTGMSPQEVAVMASIVQSETNKADEQPRVAGVYVNRIKSGIPLQADPTVKYAVGDFTLRRILNKHLSTPSPFNTYIVKGLPPGPIALPEKKALDAVLNFEKHNYVYFCAKEDFSGYHNFAASLAEHNANAAKFHKAMNERGIR